MTTSSCRPFTITIRVSPPTIYAEFGTNEARLMRAGARDNYGGLPGEAPGRILAYSGGTIEPLTGRLYLFGGGHHDYDGNEVWELDVEDPTGPWVKHYEPVSDASYADEAAVAADLDNARYPGRFMSHNLPISRHTRHTVVWSTQVGKMLAAGGSTWDGAPGNFWGRIWPNSPNDLWQYDPRTKTWEYRGSPGASDVEFPAGTGGGIRPGWPSPNPWLIDHQARNRLYTVAGYGDLHVHEYDAVRNEFSDLGSAGMPWDGFTLHGFAVDHDRDRLVFLGRLDSAWRAYTFDLASRTTTLRTLSGVAIAPPTPEEDKLLYSTFSGHYLFITPTTKGVYRIDADDWEVSTVISDDTFTGLAQACAAVWCPVRHVGFLPLNHGAVAALDVWAFRA